MRRVFLLFFLLATIIVPVFLVRADELEDVSRALESLRKDLSSKEANYQQLNTRLNDIKKRVSNLGIEITKKEDEVKKGEEALDYQKNLLNERAISYYKNINKNPLNLLTVLTSNNLSESLRGFFYQQSLVDQDKNTIIKVVLYIKNLEEIKANLETEKNQLSALKQEIDAQSKILSGQISQTRTQIAQLSARQQELIAAKLASVPVPRSAETTLGGCKSDIDTDPGFGSRFAFFSFGVPNKVGLNQYGAKGRAESGQDYEAILKAYYNFDEIKKADTNIQIRVDGHESYNLEDYIKRIYEVPESWDIKALKAQAIAARSYALAYTNNGAGSICDSEQCQVFHDQPKTGAWDQAVRETEGLAMYQGGSPIKAWFSSTHGGVVLSSSEIGWSGTSWTKHLIDTSSGSAGSFSDLQSNAYDKSSPWFYCDWGYRSQYNNTAWLKPEEVADIVNTFILYSLDKNTIIHLSQTDKNISDAWSADQVKQEIRNRGGSPMDSVNSISVSWDGYGIARTINIDGRSFDAQKFKNLFNMRAPANIQIKPACNPSVELDCSSYALFNVEKR
ncbi:hypothetical protein COV86_04815 [Candidatus Roizmanbacteria bacterium CG11_big_fil_rev_8_21_14_0_20_35_14]|uniref:Sporulation stage II protein D amidase enhancer LytB N-terminal domain-containing protein n=1 Tax=Candidatus Roizmanbacteria bacterium CG11_big_fil_rev_8_21_14_0_20_35_14 TaxID=1974855 RepID=A0A2H0KLH9_9BACT|nr:MAG: hypothetical protein COV86_04815 [Candidatus Roizmanbacteria bacterium CG11_big_fil_rev_8_21_14_0_20_35_14]